MKQSPPSILERRARLYSNKNSAAESTPGSALSLQQAKRPTLNISGNFSSSMFRSGASQATTTVDDASAVAEPGKKQQPESSGDSTSASTRVPHEPLEQLASLPKDSTNNQLSKSAHSPPSFESSKLSSFGPGWNVLGAKDVTITSEQGYGFGAQHKNSLMNDSQEYLQTRHQSMTPPPNTSKLDGGAENAI